MLLIIKIDSVVDIMTNSSSEMFVAAAELEINTIKSILRELLELHNRYFYDARRFDNVFGKIEKINKQNLFEYVQEFISWGFLPSWFKDVPDYETVAKSFTVSLNGYMYYDEIEEAYQKAIKEYYLSHKEQLEGYYVGKTVIYSREANSIPYRLFGMIEGLFDAERKHLG